MSYYGKMDKKTIVHVLDNGLGFLKDEVKNPSRTSEQNKDDFYRLEKLLYGQGRSLLSMTNQVRFEKRLNTIRKNFFINGRETLMKLLTHDDYISAMEKASEFFGQDPAYYGEEGNEQVEKELFKLGYTKEDLEYTQKMYGRSNL